MTPTVHVDPFAAIGVIVVIFAALGWRSGPRAEAVTLATLVFPALLLSNGVTRGRLVDLALSVLGQARGLLPGPPGSLALSSDQRLVVGLILFAGLVAGAHAIGIAYGRGGDRPERGQQGVGAALGGVSGLLIAVTLLAMGRGDLGTAPSLRIALPAVEVTLPSERHAIVQYAPVVFTGAFFLVAALAWRQARR